MSAPDQMTPRSPGAYADRLLADAAHAADSARLRLSGAVNDLFRPAESRLNDRDHALMGRMLAALVDAIEQRLRALLAADPMLAESSDLLRELRDRDEPIAWPRLVRSRVMRDPELIAALLRRCDEHRLVSALHSAYSTRSKRFDTLIAHDDGGIADAASALLLAESVRLDRFGEPLLDPADLPPDLCHRVTWWIAAALREHMFHSHGIDPEAADRALVTAAAAYNDAQDAAESIEGHANLLVRALQRVSALSDDLLAELFREARVAAWLAGLGARAGLEMPSLWPMLADADTSRLTLLLRAIGMDRAIALGLIADLLVARGGASAGQDERLAWATAAFDALPIEDALAAIRPWRPADHYRRAVAGLAAEDGER